MFEGSFRLAQTRESAFGGELAMIRTNLATLKGSKERRSEIRERLGNLVAECRFYEGKLSSSVLGG
jgi:hypothetical protein